VIVSDPIVIAGNSIINRLQADDEGGNDSESLAAPRARDAASESRISVARRSYRWPDQQPHQKMLVKLNDATTVTLEEQAE